MNRAAIISLSEVRERRGPAYTVQLGEAESFATLHLLHEPPQPPGRPSRWALALAGMWLLSLLTLAGSLIVIVAGLSWGLEALSALGAGR